MSRKHAVDARRRLPAARYDRYLERLDAHMAAGGAGPVRHRAACGRSGDSDAAARSLLLRESGADR